MMKISLFLIFNFLSSVFLFTKLVQSRRWSVRIVQLLRQENEFGDILMPCPVFLKMMNEQTNARFDTDPLFINTSLMSAYLRIRSFI